MSRPAARRVTTLVAAYLLAGIAACRHLPRPGGSRDRADERAAEAARDERARAGVLSDSTVSVLPFEAVAPDSVTGPLAHGLAALLLGDLAQVRSRLVVVERERLDAVLRELDLARAARIDSSAAPRVGRQLGARRIVVGVLDALPDGELLVSVRIADAATGALAGALDARAPVARILDAEKALAFRILEQLGVAPTPAERAAIEARPTENVGALLAYGRGVRDELAGDRAGARLHYQQAVFLDGGFAEARARLQTVEETIAAEGPGGPRPSAPRASLARARRLALHGINPAAPSAIGTAVDGAFPAGTGTSVVVIVTAQP